MKLKKRIVTFITIVVLVALTAIIACLSVPTCMNKPVSYVQELSYVESTEKINNPDQGFYRPIYLKVTEDGATYNKNIVTTSTRLYHLRIDISAFSKAVNGKKDKQLNKAALNGLEELFSYLKENDKNAVVRFAYDPSYEGSKDKEPALNIILKHVEQVCPILNRYKNTVTAVEAGLIGPWGEMHSSAMANAENISPIIETFLSKTKDIPVLVRTPKMIYDYLGITIKDIDDYKIAEDDKAYMLGLYNDGYLGSGSDLGTYTDREKEIEFLSGQTAHLPFGGEVVIPASPLHDIETCLPEMERINLSYLNVEWNNNVIDKWKNTYYTAACGNDSAYYNKTAFTYIENRMGYRFVLTNSTFKYSDNYFRGLKVDLSLKNVGFGNLNRKKNAKIIIADENGNAVFTKKLKEFTGSESLSFSVKPKLQSGKYEVYFQLYGEEAATPLYCLQFANDGLWNEQLKANKIGSIVLP